MAKKSESSRIFALIGVIVFIVVAAVIMQKVTTTTFDDRSKAAQLRLDKSIFTDVPKNRHAFGAIERIYRLGITGGCSQNPLKFCPDKQITRGEAAVFITRALYGADTDFPVSETPVFTDVNRTHPFRKHIEKMYAENLTAGCSSEPRMFCPDQPLSRRELAVFFTRAIHGASFVPPPATGTVFRDVTQQTPFAPYIEQLYRDGFASMRWSAKNETNLNCTGPDVSFCPYGPTTRADMAVLTERLLDRPQIFADVPINHWAFSSIQRISRAGITSGCSQSPKQYCPDRPVTRGEAAVLMLRGKYGKEYTPPASTDAPFFTDVPTSHIFYPYIQQLYRDGITSGCSNEPKRFCPDAQLTRGEAAVMLMRIQFGKDHQPPAATGGIFSDVRTDTMFGGFIEEFYREGMTVGCQTTGSVVRFCPTDAATRSQFAIFLDRLFELD